MSTEPKDSEQSSKLLKSVFAHYGNLRTSLIISLLFCLAISIILSFTIFIFVTSSTFKDDIFVSIVVTIEIFAFLAFIILTTSSLMKTRADLINWDKRYVSYGFLTSFEFSWPSDSDPVRNSCQKLVELFPQLEEEINKGKTRLSYDAIVQGSKAPHRFDAAILKKGSRRVWLIKRMDDSVIGIDEVKTLIDEIIDIAAKKSLLFFSIIIISPNFSDDAIEFADKDENWLIPRGRIDNVLFLEYNDSEYYVIWSQVNGRFIWE